MEQGHTESDTTEDTVHNRCMYVLKSMLEMIPDEAREHPMAQMLTFVIREGRKDIRRIPEDFIVNLSGQIGEAFTWVAHGSMDDLSEDGSIQDQVDQLREQIQEEIMSEH